MPKRITTEDFINKAREVHGDKYDYSKVEYVNNRTKVIIICPTHGEFLLDPQHHLRGLGCPKCILKITNTELFIEASREIHGDFYNYDKVIYKGRKNKVIITCPIHGDFELEPGNHLLGKGCLKCGYEKTALAERLSIKDFIDRANHIHNNKYNYDKVNFSNMHEKVCIICPEHGEFWQTPQKHILRKHGCPKCKQSKGETEVEKYLLLYNIKYITQYEIPINSKVNKSGKAYIDFYLPELNTAIEYNGILHYEYTPVFHVGGIIDFEKQQMRDKLAEEYCNLNGINLILISYLDDILKVLDKWRLDR